MRCNQRELGPGQLTVDGFPEELAPEAIGLPVIHNQRVHDQSAGDPEGQLSTVYLSGIHYAREAERSPSHRYRLAPDNVVHDLVPAEVGHRVGTLVSINGLADHKVLVRYRASSLLGADENRIEYGGCAV